MDAISFDAGLFVWALVTFGVLFLLLARFTFKPLRKVLDERERVIRESLAAAQKAKKEAEETLARNEEALALARDETRKIIDEGHRIVAEMKREGKQAAAEDAGRIVEEARAEVDTEVQRSLDKLKGTVAGLSLRIARQVIREELSEQRHEELADSFIERLKKTHARKKA